MTPDSNSPDGMKVFLGIVLADGLAEDHEKKAGSFKRSGHFLGKSGGDVPDQTGSGSFQFPGRVVQGLGVEIEDGLPEQILHPGDEPLPCRALAAQVGQFEMGMGVDQAGG